MAVTVEMHNTGDPAQRLGKRRGIMCCSSPRRDQLVVQSLKLGELGAVFTYEPTRVRGTNGTEEARTVQVLPVTEAKK
jgi:hypothetical protein